MNDFESIDPPAFHRELISSVADFLGQNKTEIFRTMSDLLFTLQELVKVLSAHVDAPQDDEYQNALQAMETLGGNLRAVSHFKELVRRLKEAKDSEHRMGVIEQLMVMVKYSHDHIGR